MKTIDDSIIGQDNLLKFFDKLAVLSARQLASPLPQEGGSVGGSFILLGPEGAGKKTLANLLIAKLLCQAKPMARPCGECQACQQLKAKVNGDVFWLSWDADKKNIAVDDIRGLLHAVGMSSLARGYKIAVIDRAEKLSNQAANALLKTLEEPGKKTVIVLLAAALSEIPKTVISRSQVFALRPVSSDQVYDFLVARGHKRSQAKILANISLGWPGLAIKLSDDGALNEHLSVAETFFQAVSQNILERQAALDKLLAKDFAAEDILSIWQTAARDLLLYKLAQVEWLRYGGLLGQLAGTMNFSVRQSIDWYKLVTQAKDYLSANVNQKAVLEGVMVNM